MGKGALAVFIASILTGSPILILATGFIAVIGHNWSVFLKLKGGSGACVIYGVLVYLVFLQFVIAGVLGGIFMVAMRKSGISTAIVIVSLSIILLVWSLTLDKDITTVLVIYPIILIMLMVIKRFQINGAASKSLKPTS